MAWGTELSIVATCCHLTQDILIDITHSVPIVHIKGIDTLHNLSQGAWRLDKEGGICHKATICRLLALTKCLDEHKDIFGDGAVHCLCLQVAEYAPTKLLIRNIFVCLRVVPHTLLESRVFDGSAPSISICLFSALSIIKHLHKEEICHLLQDGDGVGNTSCPKGIPNSIYTVFNLTCNHSLMLI